MFALNGVELDDTIKGWRVLSDTQPLLSLAYRDNSLVIPGRAGVRELDTEEEAPVIALVVETPRSRYEELALLCQQESTVVTIPSSQLGRELAVRVLSVSAGGYGNADALLDVTIVLRVSGGFWRSSAPGFYTTAGVGDKADFLLGSTAPVRDALIRVSSGSASISADSLRITTPRGGFVRYKGSLGPGFYLLVDTGRAKAWTGTVDSWDRADYGFQVTDDLVLGPRGFVLSPVPASTPYAPLSIAASVSAGATSAIVTAMQARGAYTDAV